MMTTPTCSICGNYVRYIPSTVRPLCGKCYLKKKADDRKRQEERDKVPKRKVGRPRKSSNSK